jgi:RNA polymerase sigma factor (sigma-70 family)
LVCLPLLLIRATNGIESRSGTKHRGFSIYLNCPKSAQFCGLASENKRQKESSEKPLKLGTTRASTVVALGADNFTKAEYALPIEGASSFPDGGRDSIMSLSRNSLALDKSQPPNYAISEAQLSSDAKRGEPEAFEALCHTLRPRLLNIALRITRNREDAEDAVQDSMMRAFVHLNDFHGNSSFSTWLTRIVMNSALMINRKNRSARQISADALPPAGEPWDWHFQISDRAPNPEQSYEQHERRTILHTVIRRLRPHMRAVIEMGQFRELPIKETAKILDISVAAAKARFFHARAALRKSVALCAAVQAGTRCINFWCSITRRALALQPPR